MCRLGLSRQNRQEAMPLLTGLGLQAVQHKVDKGAHAGLGVNTGELCVFAPIRN